MLVITMRRGECMQERTKCAQWEGTTPCVAQMLPLRVVLNFQTFEFRCVSHIYIFFLYNDLLYLLCLEVAVFVFKIFNIL